MKALRRKLRPLLGLEKVVIELNDFLGQAETYYIDDRDWPDPDSVDYVTQQYPDELQEMFDLNHSLYECIRLLKKLHELNGEKYEDSKKRPSGLRKS